MAAKPSDRELLDLTRVAEVDVPLALAEAHARVGVGGQVRATCSSSWDPERLRPVIDAGGFDPDQPFDLHDTDTQPTPLTVDATARLALPDHVGGAMRLLCCGLNPSVHAAEAGVGYVTASNRFWKAMAGAGLATRDRDPRHLLVHDHIGMTDLVKRPTPRADQLRPDEYRAGIDRLRALCGWLRPGALVVVGFAGWRAGVDRHAGAGWQPHPLGPTPVYLMPSTSGLNATTSLDALIAHLRAAADGPAPA